MTARKAAATLLLSLMWPLALLIDVLLAGGGVMDVSLSDALITVIRRTWRKRSM